MIDFDRQSLHQFLIRRYDLEGLRTLCHYLDIDYDNLDGRTKDILARELVRYMERLGRAGELIAIQTQAEAASSREIVPTERLYHLNHNPRQVFVSHAHQDAAFAHRLATDLEHAGLRVWIAPESIPPGEQWLSAIARGLQESGACIIVLTPDGVRSSWVEYETNLAISRERHGQMRIFILDVAECETPFAWTSYQLLPFRGEYEVGLEALRSAIDHFGSAPANTTEVAQSKSKAKSVKTSFLTPAIQHSPAVSQSNIHDKSGIELIRIPAGYYINRYGLKAYLPEYWIGRFPVTNAQYKLFIDDNPMHKLPHAKISFTASHRIGDFIESEKPYHWDEKGRTYPKGRSEHPVVLVDWLDIQAFLAWAGLRLPSEDEWEKAARGGAERLFPWGNDWRKNHANTLEAGRKGTSRVGHYSPQGDSLFGCVDMAGNVWEWTSSFYRKDDSVNRVIRGGSYADEWKLARTDYRLMSPPVEEAQSSQKRRSDMKLHGLPMLGFRVAIDGKRDLRMLLHKALKRE